jgi:hypothetical protein
LKKLSHALEISLSKLKIWQKMNCNSGKSTKLSFERLVLSKEVQVQIQDSSLPQQAAKINKIKMLQTRVKISKAAF